MKSKEREVIEKAINTYNRNEDCSAAEFFIKNIDNIKSGNYTDEMKEYIYRLVAQTIENDDFLIENQLENLITLILKFNNDKNYHNEYWYSKIKAESGILDAYLGNDIYYPIDDNLDDEVDFCIKQLTLDYESKKQILYAFEPNIKGLKNVTIRKLINEKYIFDNYFTEEDI